MAIVVTVPEAHGARVMVPFAPVAMACVVTVITAPPVAPPASVEAVVAILATYLLPEPDVISQPNPPAATKVGEDERDYVMLERHEEAAKIASDILARAV